MDLITLALAKKFSSDAADAWLSEHVDPETGYVLDDTLTLDNAAAPAGTVGEELNELKGTIEDLLDTKANIDGYYESMTVGNAEQLVATVGVEDSVPFNFRTTGGSADVGDRKTMEVVGGTVAWNQLCNPSNSESCTAAGITVTKNNDGSWTVDGTCTASGNCPLDSNVPVVVGHKYFVGGYPKAGSNTGHMGFAGIKVDSGNGGIYSMPAVYTIFRIDFKVGDTFSSKKFYPQVIDLTQMFGSTIADYIYSLEQANAGAGVAWFRKLFPKPYYAYNAGELMSVKTSAYKAVGFNQWDEEWEEGYYGSTGLPSGGFGYIRSKNYISVNPSTSYYCHTGTASNFCLQFYGVNKEFLSQDFNYRDSVVTTPNNCYYLRFWRNEDTYNHDICINLHWDGERDGEYEPYETHTYALDSDLELRGIPKLDADNQLYYDGDIYESNGDVTRKYKVYDLGTMTWYIDSSRPGVAYSPSKSSELKIYGGIMSANYVWLAAGVPGPSTVANYNKLISLAPSYGGGWIYVVDHAFDSLTAEEVKAALSGVYAVIEITNPTEETADPFQTPQIVNDFGTEEFVDTRTIPIPVGHNSKYQANLRAKLEMAPNSPSGDGDYIVRQSGGQNTYVSITFPADELPAAPTTDGNYVLKCTVSSGTATFEWEAQT